MPQSSLRVLVIGAGLGGLCLAQGLRKAGVREGDRASLSPLARKTGKALPLEILLHQ